MAATLTAEEKLVMDYLNEKMKKAGAMRDQATKADSTPNSSAETTAENQEDSTPSGIVQIANFDPMECELGLNCSTVAEHADFLLNKINHGNGEQLGLELEGPVKLTAIFKGKTAVFNHGLKLNAAFKYSFHFKSALGVVQGQAETGPNPMQGLATQITQEPNEMDEAQKLTEEEQGQQLEKLLNKPEEKVIKPEWRVDLEQGQEKEKSGKAQKRRVEGVQEEQNVAKQRKVQAGKEEGQKLVTEYASLIGVPTVANLEQNYNKEKLLHLIQHGNEIGPKLYIQQNQQLVDHRLVQSIVDLLASTEKPEKMIGKVIIEFGEYYFKWPQNVQLGLKGKKSNVTIKMNEASDHSDIYSHCYSAEYELTNKHSRFQVLLYHRREAQFEKDVCKFVYRRLA